MADSKYPTSGGQVTRADAYDKFMYHVQEAQDMAYILSHLHNTEDGPMEKVMAKGWFTIGELFKVIRLQVIDLVAHKFIKN